MADVHYPKGESGKQTLCGTIWIGWPDLTPDVSEVTCVGCAGVIDESAGYYGMKLTKAESDHIEAVLHPSPEADCDNEE